jgi:hypothetical protein
MPQIEWYIPEEKLNTKLEELVPAEDTILYTTAINVRKITKKKGGIVKAGELAITNRGIAFFARQKVTVGGIMSYRGRPFQEYIRYDRIAYIDGKGEEVRIRVSPPIDSREKVTEYDLIVERSAPYEDEKTFKRRKGQFSAVLEQAIYRYKTGQASPRTGTITQHPAQRARAVDTVQPRRVGYCPKCGAFLENPVSFCDSCGAPLR